FLQRGAQPGLVVSLLLILALMHVRNSRHLRDEGLDDLIDGFVDGHHVDPRRREFLPPGSSKLRPMQVQLVSRNLVRAGAARWLPVPSPRDIAVWFAAERRGCP